MSTTAIDNITPLELSHLAVKLHAAGLTPTKDFTELCGHAILLLNSAEFVLESERAHLANSRSSKGLQRESSINRLIKGKSNDDRIPIADVLECAGVNRIKLRPEELKRGLKWEEMKPDEQCLAVFYRLTHKIAPIARGDYVAKGIPTKNVRALVERIIKAHEERKSEMNREHGGRKKPRAPKGEGAKFEAKKRAPSGRWRKQS